MKISTEIGSICKHVSHEKAIEYVAKAGFDAYDFSMLEMSAYDFERKCFADSDSPLYGSEYLKFVRRLKKVADDNGIVCNQSHAPYPASIPEIRSLFKRAIECTAEAGGKICVIHPDNDKTADENAEMYLELLPFAKECGVKIATENMWNYDFETRKVLPAACSDPRSFLEHISAVNDDSFVACLDIGHAEMHGLNTSAVEMILALDTHLQALHIHDNNLRGDHHQIPFSMNIDFDAVVKALKKIDYKGYFTLEAQSYIRQFDATNVFEGVKGLAESVKKLSDMYEKL